MLSDSMTQPERIRLLRIVARLSQDELARRAGISGPWLCRIERGYVRPSPEVLDRIVRALGLPSDDAAPEADTPEGRS